MSFKSLGFVVLALLSSPTARGGSDFFIESCSLGCSSGAGGVQVSCPVSFVAQNFDLSFRFSDDVELATVDSQSFRVINPADSSVPKGTFLIDPNDAQELIFRPRATFDAQGVPTYSLEANTTYLFLIPGLAQGDAGPFVLSTAGIPNLSRLQCAVTVLPAVDLFTDVCNGAGGTQPGCTDCPCSNNALPGTIGGCLNSSGNSGRLVAAGQNITSPGALVFEARGLPSTVMALLTSASALAPANMANPCFGLGSGVRSINFDGLRCAVLGFRRHDLRVSDANGAIGPTTPGWGTLSISNLGTITSGQTRYFQVVHRDDAALVCATGLNTTQAISITFVN